MKLSLTQYDTTVTIEEVRNGHPSDDMAQFFRQLLAGQGYTEEQIKESIPAEEDVTKWIEDAIKENKELDVPQEGDDTTP